jgi:hypothetical protein
MKPHELILLSPYRFPGQNSLMVGNEDIGAFLNGYLSLWHPAISLGAAGPPRVASPYDHEQPSAGHVYAVPDHPPLFLPDDWDQRVKDAGALAFRCTLDRATTLTNLYEAMRNRIEPALVHLLDLPPEKLGPFFGIGLGYIVVESLFEAMSHDNLLATSELWSAVQEAIASLSNTDDPEAWRRQLQIAADRLQSAREVLYPVTIHVVDLCLVDPARLDAPLPDSFDDGQSLNLIASGQTLEQMAKMQPERFALLKERIKTDAAEIVGGSYLERADNLLPVDSQVWNLLRGLTVTRDLLDQDVRIYARKRFAFHPQTPLLLNTVGMNRALLLAFDESVLPNHRTTVVSWPSPDGKQVEAFTRTPYDVANPQTFFHLAHYLHKTIMQDHAATLVLLHKGEPAGPWYRDWLDLTRLSPVLGKWTTLTAYHNEVMAGEYASAASPDQFHGDHLSERTEVLHSDAPVSAFARHVRLRRRLDTAWTLAAIHRALAGKNDTLQVDARLSVVENEIEESFPPSNTGSTEIEGKLPPLETEIAEALAARLLSRAAEGNPGFLVLNPCGFIRRVALELDGVNGPLPVGGPIKAAQFDGTNAKLVAEVPALGFAWIPRNGPKGTPQPAARMKLADESAVRNEFFEAQIDPQTGGLRAIQDQRTRIPRMGQLLVYNPGSTMKATKLTVTSAGTALGEIVTEGVLLDDQQCELATFRQRFRAWQGRPILDLRIEITPSHAPEGYPWHAYYGSRFAWMDERAVMVRGVNGTGSVTTHTRPESPDYVELRDGRQATTIFPCGLPFHQRHGMRMLDVILIPQGETTRTFDLAIGLDRDYPAQTALGLATPVPLVQTSKGPPHVGATGWLFHLDMPNVAMLGMRPATDGADAVIARLLEISGRSAHLEFRCARDPQRAVVLNARGEIQMESSVSGDAALFEIGQGDLSFVRLEFS